MKVVYNRFIPFKGFKAINLFGVLFVRKGKKMLPWNWNHEKIHTAQQKDLLYVGFYLIYVLEWVFRLFQHRFHGKQAYRSVLFETEAYTHQYDYNYLTKRKRFAMWRNK